MSNQPFMQFYVGDYLADTTDLTCEEHGAYLLLLMTMWRHEAKLPSDPKKLARIARLSPRKWASVWVEISRFFNDDGALITNSRVTKEYEKARVKSDLRAQAGSKGGRAKALKSKDPSIAKATALLQHSSEPEPEPDKTDDDDGARESDFVTDSQADFSGREQLLQAMGADPISGMIGPNGRMAGTSSDMIHARRWTADLNLTISEQVDVIGDVLRRKRDGPPNSLKYFTKAMQEYAGQKCAPALTPTQPNLKSINGGQNEQPSRHTNRLQRIVTAAAAGTSGKDWG